MADTADHGTAGRPVGVGDLVGGYRLETWVGAGQLGVVWRAVGTGDGAVVAVKVLRDDLVADHNLVQRFTRDREALLRVGGPHIASLRDLVLQEGRVALVTGYLNGGSLRQWLGRHGPQPALDATALALQVFDGLADLHEAGIVHRDLTPDNILLKEDGGRMELRLSDLSLAHTAGADVTRHPRAVSGTPTYLAPEVVRGLPATPATDLYAAGIVLYELLTGAPPFPDDHPGALMHAHVEQEPSRPPRCPDELWATLATLLAKDPENRPATATDVRDQLHEVVTALVEADGTGPPPSGPEGIPAALRTLDPGAAPAAERTLDPGAGTSGRNPTSATEPPVAGAAPAATPGSTAGTPAASAPEAFVFAGGTADTSTGVAAVSTGTGTLLLKVAAIVCVAVGMPLLINAVVDRDETSSTAETGLAPTTTGPPTNPASGPDDDAEGSANPDGNTEPVPTTTTPPPVPPEADVGQCIEINPEFTQIRSVRRCRPGSSATYRVDEVVEAFANCPHPDQAMMPSGDFRLCLDLDIYEGSCYERRDSAEGLHITAIDCGSATAYRILAIAPGVTGAGAPTVCPATTSEWWEISAPQMLVCTTAG